MSFQDLGFFAYNNPQTEAQSSYAPSAYNILFLHRITRQKMKKRLNLSPCFRQRFNGLKLSNGNRTCHYLDAGSLKTLNLS